MVCVTANARNTRQGADTVRLAFLVATVLSVTFGTAVWGQELTEAPRIALVYSDYGDFRHRDDYDAKMKSLGWPMAKYENRDFAGVVEKLGEYDIILGSALYNYSNVQDFSIHKQALLAFMERGGAIVWTDANYTQHVNWLAKLGPEWAVKVERCKRNGTPMKWLDVGHPVFNAPNVIRTVGGTWSHMIPGDGWEVLAKCEDDRATGLFRRHGRGFMLLTSYWGYSPQMLENLWGTLQVYRAGVALTMPDLAGFALGDNEAETTVQNLTDQPLGFQMVVEVAGPDGKPAEHRAETRLKAGQTGRATTTVPITERGDHTLKAAFYRDGKQFFASRAVKLAIPKLLAITITEPKYRSSIYLARPANRISFHASLHPFGEKIGDLSVAARLTQANRTLATLPVRKAPGLDFDLSLPAGGVEPGTAVLEVELRQDGQEVPLTVERHKISVVAPREPQVFIDENLATRVNDDLFFPIGVYHIPIADLPRARELGFNCFQGWGTTMDGARSNLNAAQEQGMKVILEMSSFLRGKLRLDGLKQIVAELKDHPALLAWYTVDEPHGEEQLSWCRAAYDCLVKEDPHHPVYLVMCNPGAFGRFGTTTDILAIDPYPIPRSVVMVSGWMSRAQEALAGLKPVWIIPQLQNTAAYRDPKAGRGPTPEEERNMVYQGLIWGAKGVVYYPWDDGPCGLIHDARLIEAVRNINSELAELGPELLECAHRVIARNDDAHPGLYAAVFQGHTATYLIAASVLSERKTLAVPAPGLDGTGLDVMFEGRKTTANGGLIQDEFKPLEVHVYRAR